MRCNSYLRKLLQVPSTQKACCNEQPGASSFSSGTYLYIAGRHQSTAVDPQISEDPVRKTRLYDLHVSHGGKMVKFAGFYLPVQYENTSITSSHLHTRTSCSLFDVSHMLQTKICGKHSIEFLESVCVTDIKAMKNGQSALSLFTNESGGILDDFIITKIDDNNLYVVSNASRQNVDKSLLLEMSDSFCENGKRIDLEFLDSDEQSLLAIQGPKTSELLQQYIDVDLNKLYFMNSASATICGIKNCRITRCGYTGEDGVEISVPSDKVVQLVDILLRSDFNKLAGLGARDTLRLEAGLCLYGNDIDETITPVEAGLSWTISRRRRENKDFPGARIICNQLSNGVLKHRIGFSQNIGPPARSGCQLIGHENDIIGFVTSGCPSPSLGINIAMAYVPLQYSKKNTDLRVSIRNHLYDASVSKLPFIKSNYYIKPK